MRIDKRFMAFPPVEIGRLCPSRETARPLLYSLRRQGQARFVNGLREWTKSVPFCQHGPIKAE
ncbi:MAG: hypothetical protein WA743_04910, partial [Pseudolabrys sp.]